MSYKFSKKSLERLRTCHDDLQLLCHAILEDMDISVLCGHRTKEEQEEAFKAGNSRLQFPKSKHNSKPSLAVDIAPVKNGKIDWNDIKLFEKMCKLVEQKAEKMGIDIRLGRDFKTLKDYPHIELVRPKS
jgi:peptidoglycan L-alanyl-D-glutamate endopeptidase CwlK